MSHEVFGNIAGYVRKPAWHTLGTVFEEAPTAVEAVKAIGADFKYTLEPLVAAIKGPDGKRIALQIPDKRAIVREEVNEGGPEVMGIVSPTYEIIQNMQFAEALDSLTPMWPVETLGVLKRGKTVFFTLKTGSKQLGSSNIEKYFLVTDSKTGKQSTRFLYTPVRVECNNMLQAALSTAAVQGTLVHRAGVAEEFQFRTSLLSKLINVEKEVDEAFEAMTKAVLTIEQRDLVIASYWPAPKKNARTEFVDLIDEDDAELRSLRNMGVSASEEFERLINRSAVVKTEVATLWEKFNDEYPDHANTAWAVYNAVAEHADHMRPSENSPYAALFGDRARRKHAVWPIITRMIA